MAVAGALELALLPAHVGTGNDAAYTPFLPGKRNLTGNLTAAVKILQIESLLIAANLQNRIGGSVDDHRASVNLLFRKLL